MDPFVDVFFRRRWPDGFRCPQCSCHEYCEFHTRALPLYQCTWCRTQSSVTSGTIMHKSRTPLRQWAAAIDALSASPGLSGTALAGRIGVSPKVARTMLAKLRQAIGAVQEAFQLEGTVRTGLRMLAPGYIHMFLPSVRYRVERVVALSASVDADGRPTALKLQVVKDEELKPGTKRATPEGQERIQARVVSPEAEAEWLPEGKRLPDPLGRCFEGVRRWLVDVFNGVGTKQLQQHLDEYGFRWNAAVGGMSLREEWYKLCFVPRTFVPRSG